jgi:diaminohydroxyphosphoribosylaminopyrimidine deaminase/5-amino-6-(5-phosphoribosylamino)uracil reductase
MAVAEAGDAARGATAYVTLEPCAAPGRGPACADVLIDAHVARVVVALRDPFAAVDGKGFAKLQTAGIDVVVGVGDVEAARSMAGFLTRQRYGRPHVTVKLALSLDGAAARHGGQRASKTTQSTPRRPLRVESNLGASIATGWPPIPGWHL